MTTILSRPPRMRTDPHTTCEFCPNRVQARLKFPQLPAAQRKVYVCRECLAELRERLATETPHERYRVSYIGSPERTWRERRQAQQSAAHAAAHEEAWQ